jgi:hypothetical protein
VLFRSSKPKNSNGGKNTEKALHDTSFKLTPLAMGIAVRRPRTRSILAPRRQNSLRPNGGWE